MNSWVKVVKIVNIKSSLLLRGKDWDWTRARGINSRERFGRRSTILLIRPMLLVHALEIATSNDFMPTIH